MKLKKIDIFLIVFLIAISIVAFLTVNIMNVVQSISVTMTFFVAWGWLVGHFTANISTNNKLIVFLIIASASTAMVILIYVVIWQYIPMDLIEKNSHFGPTETIEFNKNPQIGTHMANILQQIAIAYVFYGLSRYVSRLKK